MEASASALACRDSLRLVEGFGLTGQPGRIEGAGGVERSRHAAAVAPRATGMRVPPIDGDVVAVAET
ncbi:hypothetical protein [Methylobacterium planeticum]|uniref:Uncharacterized protein n=1 Tax=Methylobacterium planeticum TaxID=2615211 RepID=A0A6N6MY86_9HYPH|nr:hypothetical protein [Methylobacterium planeticum]KAB1075147.1 hypothetical protein F6X51_04470 [Methylobacterium planeticum]